MVAGGWMTGVWVPLAQDLEAAHLYSNELNNGGVGMYAGVSGNGLWASWWPNASEDMLGASTISSSLLSMVFLSICPPPLGSPTPASSSLLPDPMVHDSHPSTSSNC